MKIMKNNECDSNLPNNKGNMTLEPNFVTDLIDAEGCFSIFRKKDDKAKFKVHFSSVFKIKMFKNEIELLRMVKLFFGCGNTRYNSDGTVDF
jgi:hypothetical protein